MKILVVDDSSTFRAIAKSELIKGGHEIIEAVNGQDALDKLALSPVDLITLDVEMPVLNGYEAFVKLRSAEFADIIGMLSEPPPVIFVTSRDSLEERRKGFDIGATDFITKPFLPGELLAAVDHVLRPENKFNGLTAIVADDSKTIRSMLSEILKKEGMNVIQVADGREAFETCRTKLKEIDLLITDFDMPNMTGLALCKKIRGELNHKGMAIIVMSGSADNADVLELFKAGATDYVKKPFPKEELLARINVHMNVRLLNRRLNRQLAQVKRLGKMRDNFLAICSHDIRGPLGTIKGFAQLLREQGLSHAEIAEFSNAIEASSDFLLFLVNELLDLEKMQSNEDMEMQPLSLSEVIEASKLTIKHLSNIKDIKVDIEDKTDANLRVLGNQSAIIRIINNLLSNAIKFTPKNGNVQLILEPVDGKVSLSVVDSGVGIPKDKIPQLFNKYSKASRLGTDGEKGTGLGLSIVKELVDMHGGSIDVASEEGKGTKFQILFPVKE
jgi:DNA-binding response OmpR family regulator/two-component sensor histidine kinase